MSPSEIDDLPISSVIEYCEQTQRIIDEETKAWQTKRNIFTSNFFNHN